MQAFDLIGREGVAVLFGVEAGLVEDFVCHPVADAWWEVLVGLDCACNVLPRGLTRDVRLV